MGAVTLGGSSNFQALANVYFHLLAGFCPCAFLLSLAFLNNPDNPYNPSWPGGATLVRGNVADECTPSGRSI
jgi:hypothetical protein